MPKEGDPRYSLKTVVHEEILVSKTMLKET